ncbi:DNA repair ATPase [Streptomyces alkaliphilus]|uniref:DNA repair ATPase n=1 Tax=Streptomyces alkaliphilus TaxID=1472722 RepID=UPI00118103C7|nr:DNA repair ATPase [Streptomyces alkaliphilus]MQS06306.1 DNA repair ATPase [Streptomyces alkaliphilus]
MSSEMDAGTYEVLRDRMTGAAAELARRAQRLNTRRTETFGSTELRPVVSDRLRTEHNCVPRDIVQVGGLLLAGYRVRFGLKPTTEVGDVFGLHRHHPGAEGARFTTEPLDALPGLLDDPVFLRDFDSLFRYYRQAELLQLRHVENLLLAVFRTGERLTDIRVLRWRLDPDGTPHYVDAKGERDHVFPPAHDFEWVPTTREDHVTGEHPHVAVDGELFVSTLDGRLTVRVEDNTDAGREVFSEPVDEPLQSLADADIARARVGALILLRVLPYNEETPRHLVFNTRTREVVRLDGIGLACRALPEDQGIVFPGGYYLAAAPPGSAARVLATTVAEDADLEYTGTLRSPNGEDVLYVFHARAEGHTLLLPYNLIRKEVATPLVTHGYSLFDDGTMVVFRAEGDEPGRVHPVQVWETPFVSDAHHAERPVGEGPLARVGNAELVRGVSDALTVARMADELAPDTAVFEAVVAACTRLADRYHWMSLEGMEALHEPLATLHTTAEQVIDEYRRVVEQRRHAAESMERARQESISLIRRSRGEAPRDAGGWVDLLTELRRAQGRAESLREIRRIDPEAVDALVSDLAEALEAAGRRAVSFLSREDAFEGPAAEIAALGERAAAITRTADADPLGEEITGHADRLRTVTDVVGGLDIPDATVRTGLLERIGEVLGAVNRARAVLDGRRREVLESEGRAEFAAEFALLGQAVTGALASAGTPDECDEQLGRLLLQLENLEARFGTFDEFLARLEEQREEIYETFSARKQAQLDERARHARRIADGADRVLATVSRRAGSLADLDEVNAWFAGDPLVGRVRAAAAELRDLGDTVRAGELEGRLAAIRQEAVRALRDRADLYGPDGTVRLGRHAFAVTDHQVDLTLVPTGDTLAFTIGGTDYRAPLTDPSLADTRAFWDQPLVSESPRVYRAEHLAGALLAERGAGALIETVTRAVAEEAASPGVAGDLLDPAVEITAADLERLTRALLPTVRRAAEAAYDEGHDRGVHDHDAARLLAVLLRLHAGADLLRFPPRARADAQFFWSMGTDPAARRSLLTRAHSLGRARRLFGTGTAVADLRAELAAGVADFTRATEPVAAPADPAAPVDPAADDPAVDDPGTRAETAGAYLLEELAAAGPADAAPGTARRPAFVAGPGARALLEDFRLALGTDGAKEFTEDLRALDGDPAAARRLADAWLAAFAADRDRDPGDVPEAVALELCAEPGTGEALAHRPLDVRLSADIDGLLGTHPRVRNGRLGVRLDEFLVRTERFRRRRVPAHRAWIRRRNALLDAERERLRLDSFRPRVMSGFVRNRLIDEVYLPLIGDNLAKQLGTAGEERRTDSQGLLMLLSPPGYGKTTLMEYVASRLGLILVKVDGPALGYGTTSLDPAAAPDAAARREVEKLNFGLEMGNNVLLYLDDIQHCSPEFLQRFIPLCDAQRRIDGVGADGRAVTRDLRGKRFAVCMAGNPFTGGGSRFRVPDMLANRADVWNLGDVLSGREELFALSHIENALTSNPVLAPLAGRDPADVDLLVRLARGDATADAEHLSHPYGAADLEQILAVLDKLLRVRRTTLRVNAAYIASATQDDAHRTEPPFRLQGSYRNTNRLTERLVPVMTDEEVEAVIDDHYLAEAQTLTSGAEANLLKLAELRGRITPEQTARWEEIKRSFRG